MEELKKLQREYSELLNQLSDPELISNYSKLEELSKKKIFLEKIIQKKKDIKNLEKRIEENNFLPPKVVLRYFPFWEDIKSEEYVYSIIYTGIKCEDEEFIEYTFFSSQP